VVFAVSGVPAAVDGTAGARPTSTYRFSLDGPHATSACFAKTEAKLSIPMFIR
jgi:hypothetical protein